jgi:hypothetical protein
MPRAVLFLRYFVGVSLTQRKNPAKANPGGINVKNVKRYTYLRLPTKNSAMVPGPECAPMMGLIMPM